MKFATALTLALSIGTLRASAAQSVIGDWEGILDAGAMKLHLVLHLAQNKKGALQGSVDSIDQPGGNGIAITTAAFGNGTLTFSCSSIMASFEGRFTIDGATLEGTWTQLKPFPMVWKRAGGAIVKPAEVSDFAGAWQGDLRLGLASLALVVHLAPSSGGLSATMDSPDQNAFGIPARSAKLDNGFLTVDWKELGAVYSARMNAGQSALEGTFRQNGVEGQLILKRVKDEIELTRRRPQMPAPPYPYREEQVSYRNAAADVKLAATLTVPQGAGPFPAVVLIAGSGPNDRDESIAGHKLFLVLADHLTREGIAVLRFDKRGVGESTGHFSRALTVDFASDVEAGVSYLASRKEVDGRRIGLIGHSEGGIIAPMVAARNHNVAFIVLLAGPGVSGPELAAEQTESAVLLAGGNQALATENAGLVRKIVAALNRTPDHPAEIWNELRRELGPDYSEPTVRALLKKFEEPWLLALLAIDPAEALRKVTCPVLALNGSKDTQVPARPNLEAIGEALESGGNRHAEVTSLPGLNHLFQTAQTGAPAEYGRIEETMSPIALEKISSWILKTANGIQ